MVLVHSDWFRMALPCLDPYLRQRVDRDPNLPLCFHYWICCYLLNLLCNFFLEELLSASFAQPRWNIFYNN